MNARWDELREGDGPAPRVVGPLTRERQKRRVPARGGGP